MDIKLGLQSAILADLSFEEVMELASEQGFACVELMCWPKGRAERRYAGVTHVDVDALDDEAIAHIQKVAKEKGVSISGLGYYPNPMDPDEEKRKTYIEHIKKVITAAGKLGVEVMNTFIGRDPAKSVEESFEMFREIWPPIIKHAQECKVKVAIENCPMIFTMDEWPGGKNLATTPVIWRRMFEEIPSDYFGLNYDPSHPLWMQMDYISPIYEFKHKLFHIHIKDAKVYKDKLNQVGIMATPLEYHQPKLPGLGDVDWGKFVSALTDVGYEGACVLELEDRAFEGSFEDIKKSIVISKRFMEQYMV